MIGMGLKDTCKHNIWVFWRQREDGFVELLKLGLLRFIEVASYSLAKYDVIQTHLRECKGCINLK